VSRRLVIEADGGSRGNPGPAAYGALVRDADSGEVLVERAEAIGIATNNVAEYRGLIAGLEEACRLDPEAALEVRMDSKLVVEQMAGRWKIKHAGMRDLAVQAQRLRNPSTITWTWVPRAENSHADRLLNEVLDGNGAQPTAQPVLRPASLGEPTTLYLLRHGETPLTADRRFSGRGGQDVGLTAAGKRQVQHAATVLQGRLGGQRLAAVVASPLLRTMQSAAIVAERLGASVDPDDEFAEMAFGEWDGLTFGEARGRDAAYFDSWLTDATKPAPGGESLSDVDVRVRAAQQRLVERYTGERVLVVAHAMPVKLLVAAALLAPIEAAHRVDVTPASLTEIAYWSDGRPSVRALGLL
jgi:ribonuclease H / adenosylcobalamin/alpha-ribazole phosphatase